IPVRLIIPWRIEALSVLSLAAHPTPSIWATKSAARPFPFSMLVSFRQEKRVAAARTSIEYLIAFFMISFVSLLQYAPTAMLRRKRRWRGCLNLPSNRWCRTTVRHSYYTVFLFQDGVAN